MCKQEYADVAEALGIGEGVKTIDRRTTMGVLRALARLDRLGAQRTIDGVLWVWRTR